MCLSFLLVRARHSARAPAGPGRQAAPRNPTCWPGGRPPGTARWPPATFLRHGAAAGRLVDRADDERVDRRRLAGEPGGGNRALRNEDTLAHAAAQHVECHQPGSRALGLHFQEGPVRYLRQPASGPDVSDHHRGKHQRSFTISTPVARARSRASGVSTARRPSTSRAPARADAATIASVTAPFSTRWLGCADPGTAAAASRKRSLPERTASRCFGFSNKCRRCRTNAARSASVLIVTTSTESTCSRTVCGNPACPGTP